MSKAKKHRKARKANQGLRSLNKDYRKTLEKLLQGDLEGVLTSHWFQYMVRMTEMTLLGPEEFMKRDLEKTLKHLQEAFLKFEENV